MPIATPEIYSEMIDRAKAGGFAFPAVNVTSSQTLNAAIRGFAEAESDGIIQVSTGGAAYWSGASVKDMVAGSLGFAAFAREVAKNYNVNIALHTDHCPKDKLDGFVLPLLAASEAEVKAGRNPLFNSHMWDGSAETLQDNLRIARELLERTAAAKMILEVEIGTVGGEEDGVENEINEKLYTTVEDALATVDALGSGENGRYITALWPSIGDWLASVDQVPVCVLRKRVVRSGPASTTRPSGATNMNGYNGICRAALGIAASVFVAGS